jgi:hypothetical protein
MVKIINDKITFVDNKFLATCICGKINSYSVKDNALNMLDRKTCSNCKVHYTNKDSVIKQFNIYLNKDKKWCSNCPKCGVEQAYTRRDHAVESSRGGKHCKKCAQDLGKFSKSNSVGDKTRLFNKFSKSAKTRDIQWNLTEEEMFENYNGFCSLTKLPLSLKYKATTASLDRINNDLGYIKGNIQWVHINVNMMKNKYTQEEFIEVCKLVAKNN